jgi:hypothetical protein
MKQALCILAFSLVFVLSPTIAQASNPPIAGQVSGLELCPQFICGAAIFIGGFQGQIGFNPNASGVVTTALKHGDLPTEINDWTPIYGGVWELKTLFRRFSGIVTGGKITYVGGNFFHVEANLVFSGGTLTFDGFLDHNTLIPNFGGTLQ